APEIQRHMPFERCRDEHDLPPKRVGRHAPFEGLFGIRQDGVNAPAHMAEDRLREWLRLGDIGVDARIVAHRKPPPSISRTTPIKITKRLRLRPDVLREIIPNTAPMIAKGMMNQFAQPSSGMKAMRAKTSATAPMISDTRLNMGSAVASFRRLRQPRRS